MQHHHHYHCLLLRIQFHIGIESHDHPQSCDTTEADVSARQKGRKPIVSTAALCMGRIIAFSSLLRDKLGLQRRRRRMLRRLMLGLAVGVSLSCASSFIYLFPWADREPYLEPRGRAFALMTQFSRFRQLQHRHSLVIEHR